MLTAEQLLAVMPVAAVRIPFYVDALNESMTQFGVTTELRQAAFLAQIAHESGELRYTEEIAPGTAYEGRLDLGNTHPGDGVKYKGHGLIQITGRTNHLACGLALGLDLITVPMLITEPLGASMSAAWFWQSHGCNELADSESFGAITKRINGGYNGLDQRLRYWLAARKVLAL